MSLKRHEKKILLSLLGLITFFIVGRYSVLLADECDTIPNDQANIGSKITCLSSKVSQLSSQANTLKNQIAQLPKSLATEKGDDVFE